MSSLENLLIIRNSITEFLLDFNLKSTYEAFIKEFDFNIINISKNINLNNSNLY